MCEVKAMYYIVKKCMIVNMLKQYALSSVVSLSEFDSVFCDLTP